MPKWVVQKKKPYLGHDATADVDAATGQGAEAHVASLSPNDGAEQVHSLNREGIAAIQGGLADFGSGLQQQRRH